MTQLLLEHGALINAIDEEDQALIHLVAQQGNTKILKLLLAHHADIKIEDKSGNISLVYAVENNHLEATKLLLNHMGNIKEWNVKGFDDDLKGFLYQIAPTVEIMQLLAKNGMQLNQFFIEKIIIRNKYRY